MTRSQRIAELADEIWAMRDADPAGYAAVMQLIATLRERRRPPAPDQSDAGAGAGRDAKAKPASKGRSLESKKVDAVHGKRVSRTRAQKVVSK